MAKSRKPTYGDARRLARLLIGLQAKPFGWSVPAVLEALEVSEKTLRRYLDVAADELRDAAGKPLIQVVRRGSTRLLRLSPDRLVVDGTVYAVASLFFARRLLSCLDGTVFGEGARDLWERIQGTLGDKQRRRLRDLERKLYAAPDSPVEYGRLDSELDLILRCLLDGVRVRIVRTDPEETLVLDPYTLAHARGGLWLLGWSRDAGRIVALSVDRIRTVEVVKDASGAPERFEYPRAYDPAHVVAENLPEATRTAP